MFQISIRMVTETETGLEALDTRRALGLADNSRLIMRGTTNWVEVPESFARQYFDRHSTRLEQVLLREDWDLLHPGDIHDEEDSGAESASIRKDLPVERIKELWIALYERVKASKQEKEQEEIEQDDDEIEQEEDVE
jgi:hypothetical protein